MKGRFDSIQKEAHTKEEHTCKTLQDCLKSLAKHRLKELVQLKLILNHFEGQTCHEELDSVHSFDVGSAHAGSAPGFSSETQENNENNKNYKCTDLNISSLPSKSTSTHCQDQTSEDLF
jgi:hypothetical protein